MKRTTIIGKKQILSVAMVLALSAAVWLNVKYATNGTEFGGTTSIKDSELGSAKYVANTNVKTENEQNYFEKARSDREDTALKLYGRVNVIISSWPNRMNYNTKNYETTHFFTALYAHRNECHGTVFQSGSGERTN